MRESRPVERGSAVRREAPGRFGRDAGASVAQILLALVILAVTALVIVVALRRVL